VPIFIENKVSVIVQSSDNKMLRLEAANYEAEILMACVMLWWRRIAGVRKRL
jgi:hypothetical protein